MVLWTILSGLHIIPCPTLSHSGNAALANRVALQAVQDGPFHPSLETTLHLNNGGWGTWIDCGVERSFCDSSIARGFNKSGEFSVGNSACVHPEAAHCHSVYRRFLRIGSISSHLGRCGLQSIAYRSSSYREDDVTRIKYNCGRSGPLATISPPWLEWMTPRAIEPSLLCLQPPIWNSSPNSPGCVRGLTRTSRALARVAVAARSQQPAFPKSHP
jgi:hypothetical protein